MKYRITIFTPTYNRAYTLNRLYDSLIKQNIQNFEWLIIDDGSTDETESVVQLFVSEGKINIRYFKQHNGGKHRAINKGVELANGELFFIVDSDDYLHHEAVEKLIYHYNNVKDKDLYGGVSGLKVFASGEKTGGEQDFGILDCNALDFRYKHNIRGDMAEAYKTKVLRQFPFPDIEKEKFCPEALVWNRIAQQYKLRYFYERIYYCNYLADGLTAKITKIRMKSPVASMMTYAELVSYNIPLIQSIKSIINFWRFSFNSNMSVREKIKMLRSRIALCLLPFGWLVFLHDKRKYK